MRDKMFPTKKFCRDTRSLTDKTVRLLLMSNEAAILGILFVDGTNLTIIVFQ